MALAGATHITIVNRSEDRGTELVSLLNEKVSVDAQFVKWEGDYSIPDGTDVVINATSIGLFPDVDARIAVDTSGLKEGMVAADVIPNPPETNFVRDARAAGCKVIDGLGMLVNQGVIGVEYWSGISPDPGVMRKALEDVFGE